MGDTVNTNGNEEYSGEAFMAHSLERLTNLTRNWVKTLKDKHQTPYLLTMVSPKAPFLANISIDSDEIQSSLAKMRFILSGLCFMDVFSAILYDFTVH